MAFNIPKSLQNINASGLQKGLQQYVVSPSLNLGLAGFVFSVKKNISITRKAEITDNPVEDNSVIQDHIGIKPTIIEISGFIGEVVHTVSPPNNETVQKITEKVSIAASLIPAFTKGVKQAKNIKTALKTNNKANLLSAATNGADLYKTFKELNLPQTAQAKAYNFFNSVFEARQIVSLETPYRFFTNMVVESITAIQDESTETVTDFTLTLKKIKFANVNFNAISAVKGRMKKNITPAVSKGNIKGKEASFFIKTLDKFKL